MMLPRNINGLYDARHEIEISTDLILSELLIEIHHPSNKVLTKEELIALYLSDKTANYYNSTLRGNNSFIETFSIKYSSILIRTASKRINDLIPSDLSHSRTDGSHIFS